jgi:hypothetical protein
MMVICPVTTADIESYVYSVERGYPLIGVFGEFTPWKMDDLRSDLYAGLFMVLAQPIIL